MSPKIKLPSIAEFTHSIGLNPSPAANSDQYTSALSTAKTSSQVQQQLPPVSVSASKLLPPIPLPSLTPQVPASASYAVHTEPTRQTSTTPPQVQGQANVDYTQMGQAYTLATPGYSIMQASEPIHHIRSLPQYSDPGHVTYQTQSQSQTQTQTQTPQHQVLQPVSQKIHLPVSPLPEQVNRHPSAYIHQHQPQHQPQQQQIPYHYIQASPHSHSSHIQRHTSTQEVKKKRPRRKASEMVRLYSCNFRDCQNSYGTLNHLNAHIQFKKHGAKRKPEEFKQIRELYRIQNRRKIEHELALSNNMYQQRQQQQPPPHPIQHQQQPLPLQHQHQDYSPYQHNPYQYQYQQQPPPPPPPSHVLHHAPAPPPAPPPPAQYHYNPSYPVTPGNISSSVNNGDLRSRSIGYQSNNNNGNAVDYSYQYGRGGAYR
ncbi:hypothetical protein WICPIJ_001324 [Wickerhamomyces pijperi]|uniref:C2H2-type domain-containing protein n=1 Tax=Wickerhamomyces pijperi TaxID=599730 RepID=A0A9P8QBW5_WICPI|nr:hypothetical protein WICPIJ_001324 [Wickerhamomyces pijperi]